MTMRERPSFGDRLNYKTWRHQRERIRSLARKLWDCFPWHLTPQGAAYWMEVHKNLEALGSAQLPRYEDRCGTCGGEQFDRSSQTVCPACEGTGMRRGALVNGTNQLPRERDDGKDGV